MSDARIVSVLVSALDNEASERKVLIDLHSPLVEVRASIQQQLGQNIDPLGLFLYRPATDHERFLDDESAALSAVQFDPSAVRPILALVRVFAPLSSSDPAATATTQTKRATLFFSRRVP